MARTVTACPRYWQVLVSRWTLPEMELATFTSQTFLTTGYAWLIPVESFTPLLEWAARHLAVRGCQLSRLRWGSHLAARSARMGRSIFRNGLPISSCGSRLRLRLAIPRHSWVRTFRRYHQ